MIIKKKRFDEERAFYGSENVNLSECEFSGAADGESAFKESRNILAEKCQFKLRYPFWHCFGVDVRESIFSNTCRAPLWYSKSINISMSSLHGTKAIRECRDVDIRNTDIISDEFGWYSDGVEIANSSLSGEYALMRSKNLKFKSFSLKGKYSFQYIENATFESCNLDTKDAFWHAKGVTVKNCRVKGEYLAWYAEDITFINCKIIGTQPLCYCHGVRIIDCEMIDTDLAFEKSDVQATITSPVISIKNPRCGRIELPSGADVILDDPNSKCEIVFKD